MKFVAFALIATLLAGLTGGCNSGPGGASNAEMIARYNKDLPPDTGKGPGTVPPERPIMPGKRVGK